MSRASISSTRSSVTNRGLIQDFSKSLIFNGSSTFLTCPVTPSTTGVSFGLWVLFRKVSTQQRLVAWVAGGPNGGFFLEKGTSGSGKTLHFDVYNGAGQVADLITSDMPINEWVHVVCTFKTNEAKIYINSVLKATDTSCTMSTPAAQTLTLGRSSSASSAFFYGLMDKFILQNTDTPWTQAQIEDLYFRNITPSGATVIYEMNDTVTDSSGNGNDGTLTNGTYSTNVPRSTRAVATTRIPIDYQASVFDKMRCWEYNSNYLGGSSSNSWFVQSSQIPYDATDILAAGIHTYKIYVDENNASSHLDAMNAILAVDPAAYFLVLRFITYNTDYSEATGGTNRTAAIAKFTGTITNLMGQTRVLAWGFGNENNYNLDTTSKHDWYTLVEAAVQAGKAIDNTRPFYSVNGELADIRDYGNALVPSIDAWGANIYRGKTFTDIIDRIVAATNKPFFISEFGRTRSDNTQNNQDTQASEILSLIREAESYFPIIRGWSHFKFTDTVVPGTVWGVTSPQTQGVYSSRTKYSGYNFIKSFCTKYLYGYGL